MEYTLNSGDAINIQSTQETQVGRSHARSCEGRVACADNNKATKPDICLYRMPSTKTCLMSIQNGMQVTTTKGIMRHPRWIRLVQKLFFVAYAPKAIRVQSGCSRTPICMTPSRLPAIDSWRRTTCRKQGHWPINPLLYPVLLHATWYTDLLNVSGCVSTNFLASADASAAACNSKHTSIFQTATHFSRRHRI